MPFSCSCVFSSFIIYIFIVFFLFLSSEFRWCQSSFKFLANLSLHCHGQLLSHLYLYFSFPHSISSFFLSHISLPANTNIICGTYSPRQLNQSKTTSNRDVTVCITNLYLAINIVWHTGAPDQVHAGPAVAALMKLSFDEEHRHAVCTLGERGVWSRYLIRA